MAIFLGIDGGGSKTACVVGDESSILGRGAASASNLVRVGEEKSRASLSAAIDEACAAAKISAAEIAATCVGVAGAARKEVSSMIHQMISQIVAGKVQVVGDHIIALEAAFAGETGVIVIAGTGSIAYGRNASGETLRAGGWGFAISDEGSGHWIGRAAIVAILRALDEGRNPALFDGLLEAWGVTSRDQLVLKANAAPSDFAALVPAIVSAADAGDPLARDILARAGTELATLARIVVQRQFAGVETVPVAMSGGVFRHCALVREVFYNVLQEECPHARVQTVVVEPVLGALSLARRQIAF